MARPDHALIVADGDVDDVALRRLAEGSPSRPLLVAADGGAARVLENGLTPDLVVGDLDSLDDREQEELAARGIEVRAADSDKDESDMELCLQAAMAAGMADITILGALGVVRPEHTVANLLLLADPRLDGRHVAIVGRGSRIWRMGTAAGPGHAVIEGEPGDYVSLFPLGAPVDGVTTSGLRFPLDHARLTVGPSLGLSNELLGQRAAVSTERGCLLVVHTHRSMSDVPATGGP